jgi:hypothetical protein
MGEMRNAYKISIGIPEATRPLRGLRHRWETFFKMNLKQIEYESVDWMGPG